MRFICEMIFKNLIRIELSDVVFKFYSQVKYTSLHTILFCKLPQKSSIILSEDTFLPLLNASITINGSSTPV